MNLIDDDVQDSHATPVAVRAPINTDTGNKAKTAGASDHFDNDAKQTPSSVLSGLINFASRKSVSVILQTEASECGMACVAMLANFHREQEIDLMSIRARYPTSLRGARLNDLIDLAAQLGLNARPVKLELDALAQLDVPCILHWNLNHFVVLTKVTKKHIDIIDPAVGKRRLSIVEASKCFTGVALELLPGLAPELIEKVDGFSLTSMFAATRGLKSSLLQIFTIALALELTALLAPQFVKLTIDQVVANQDLHLLEFLGISFSLLLLIKLGLEALRSWSVVWLNAQISAGWSSSVFAHMMRLPMEYFSKRFLGDIISRFGSVAAIQQSITTQLVTGILDGMMAVFTSMLLIYYSPQLAAVTFSGTFLYALIRFIYYRVLREKNLTLIQASAKQQGTLIESLRGMLTIRMSNKSAQQTGKFLNVTTNTINASGVLQKLNIYFDSASALISGAQRIAVIWLGAWLVVGGQISAGLLMAFLAYSEMFASRFISLINYFVQLRLLGLHVERLSDIVLTKPESHVEQRFVGQLNSLDIEFLNVSFRYADNTPDVLHDCGFKVKQGEIVAICGKSGSGKSTVAKLLMGIYDYQQGIATLGGVDIRSLGKEKVRSLTACVFQETQLFSGSILSNIAQFDQSISVERVIASAEKACIAHEINAMPMGYQTLIGDMGSALSSGQQQRVLLARAFCQMPQILLLDEATSHLDLINERKICEFIRSSGITTIMIAHRPETLRIADRVLCFENRKLRELERGEY